VTFNSPVTLPTDPPTPEPTLTPTPSPTPDPQTLIQEAQTAAHNGDDTQAVSLYQQALSMMPDPHSEQALNARFALGKSQSGAGDTSAALATFTSLVSETVTSTVVSDARVLLGQAAASSGDPTQAIAHFEAALGAGTPISPYLALWTGDAYIAANQPLSAVVPYQQAVEGAPTLSLQVTRREKLALAYQLAGQYSAALEQYDAILAVAKIVAYRARIEWQSAQVLVAMGQTDTAYQRMRDVMTSAPSSAAAFAALQALVEAGQTVDELQRGIIDYYNGSYPAAQQAFKRAISSGSDINEVRYWAALNYVELNSAEDAFRNLNEIIGSGPEATRYGDALLEKGDLLAFSDDVDNAVVTYRLLASTAPSDPQAPVALQRVGRVYERASQIDQTAQSNLDAYAAYPQAEGAAETLLRGVIALHRLNRDQEAISQTQALLTSDPTNTQASLAQFWLGKLQIAAGQVITGQATLNELVLRQPDSYEGTRAAELAADVSGSPLGKPIAQIITPTLDTQNASQEEAEKWLRARLNISDTVDVRTLQPEVLADARMARGSILWRMGLQAEANDEFDALRTSYSDNALATYQLALYFRDIGIYRLSIGCADTLMHLTSANTISETPAFIAKLVYPIYYTDLISANATEYGLDPLLVAGLIRQESLFEAFAESGASAFGLMQVVPSTASGIVTALGWPPNYSDRDLTRPYVSIRFGTYYLARQRDSDALKGDLYGALAAYNGGPGMAMRWRERSGGDPDAFYMTMPLDGSGYRETQAYIRTVTANYAIYHRLYAGD
jgi:soluble lytic murein transglycosylase